MNHDDDRLDSGYFKIDPGKIKAYKLKFVFYFF